MIENLINILYLFNKEKRREARRIFKYKASLYKIKAFKQYLRKKYPSHYIILPMSNFGDLFFLCSMLKQFKIEKSGKILLLCPSKNHMDFAQRFSAIDDFEVIEDIYPILFTAKYVYKPINFKKGRISFVSTSNLATNKRLQCMNLNIKEFYSKLLYLNEPVALEEPLIKEEDTNVAKIHFDKLNLSKNTILLSPFSNHAPSTLSVKFWKKLADKLISMGYSVVFNNNDKCKYKDYKFKNYKQIYLPHFQQLEFAKLCCHVIGLRSGFLDILAACGIKNLTAIYIPSIPLFCWDTALLNRIFETDIFNEVYFDGNESYLKDSLISILERDKIK
jgi:hypothetical protein